MKKNNFLNKFNYKLLNINKLKKKIGGINRKRKVIMCHGNFDIVHPGHIRHLVYAKTKAPILIVSVTSDTMITKGNYKPHVPQKLRAFNLAALEIVDYVLIDNNKTSIKNLQILKPNYYAKGFEYSNISNSDTAEEKKVIEKFGGQIIFTPGDLIYSSSKIISQKEPKIDNEKILNFLNESRLSLNKIRKLFDKKNLFTVHVVGDVIVDKYTNTSLIGMNSKTPTPSVLFKDENKFVGGASIVAMHLKKIGIKTVFTSVTGKDENSKFVKTILENNEIKTNIYEDTKRITTEKNIIETDSYKTLKIDKLDNTPIDSAALKFLVNKIKSTKADAIIFSDFRHGIFNKISIEILLKEVFKNEKIIKIADSQVASRWGNISDFKNFDIITPNEKEARFSIADQDCNISELTRQLYVKNNFKNLILKLSSRGIFTVSKKKAFVLPSFVSNCVDAVGAGDAMLAGVTYGFLHTKSIEVASFIGSLSAACECEVNGNIPIEKEIIIKKIELLKKNLSSS
jgi:rfaE bifunctional protein kinase chain/domain